MAKKCDGTIRERGVVVAECDLPAGHEGRHHCIQPSEMVEGLVYEQQWEGSLNRQTGCLWMRGNQEINTWSKPLTPPTSTPPE